MKKNLLDIVIATKNNNKLNEIRLLLKEIEVNIIGLQDGRWSIKEIHEDGETFKENAIKKATIVYGITNKITIADDSGIQIDALGGKPGVYSKRFAGPNATDKENNIKLLSLMQDIPYERRSAQFNCAIAVAGISDKVEVVEGVCRGFIGFEEKGNSGFGYDPLFVYPDYNKTFAELDLEVKNKISHRAKALEKTKLIIERVLLKKHNISNQ